MVAKGATNVIIFVKYATLTLSNLITDWWRDINERDVTHANEVELVYHY